MTQQICEPVALVGSACRFPGGCDSPSKLWDVLRKPRDLARPIPKERFNIGAFYHPEPTHHGTTNTRQAYFLDEDLSKFDAQFFGTPPSEVESMDPQQRLLMETVYDSLCAAGLPVESLRGSSTAVYVGIMCDDWSTMLNKNTDAIPTYTATGTARSIASNRISYFFDWHGASMTIDTACSSSLVAVHEAVRVLRTGESKVAVAAGANLILSPAQFVAESNLRMLSPTGRSRMWDASADGYVRGEGIAAVVLKTLSQALADGDPIECIIRETGVNQDGRTSGLTVPSNIAQTRLIRETYARVGLDLAKVSDRPQFFHAHGTGTKAGDPQEAQAIHNAFFADFADEITHASGKLHVGSIKTIIGHTEGTAGLASLIGTSLAIRNNTIPPNMHFHTLNPTITPYYTHLQVPTVARQWPALAPGAVKRASINSFGFGGTNAHAIIEEFVAESSLSSALTSPALQPTLFTPLVFSAESAASLKSMLSDYHQYLTSHPRISLRNLSCTLRHRRSTLSHRKVIAGRDYDDVCDKIVEAIDDSNANIETRSATVTNPVILGIFTGQGAQWPRMGAELLEASPFVARRIAEMDESLALLPEADRPQWTIKEQLLAEASSSRITEAALSQPLCTAIQVVMVDLMQAAGIRYKAVVGHSSGEIGAAYAAGLVSARDAIRIAYYRGLYAKFASSPRSNVKGAMAAVGMSHSEAEHLCDTEAFKDRICVAAYNSSSSLTLSGDEDAIDEVIGVLKTDSIFARRLKVDTAYHSPHMQTCAHHYLRSINQCGIVPSQPSEDRPNWYSSVEENALMTTDSLNNQYWVNNMTQPVLFSSAIIAAAEATGSFDMAIEIGPHPALKGPAVDNLGELGITLPYTGLLSRGKDDIDELSTALGFIWENLGAGSVDFDNFDKTIHQDGTSREVLTGLPNYPFNHQRSHWTKSRHSADHKQLNLPPNPVLGHPCVDTTTPSEAQWRNFLRPQEISWLQGHKLQGQIIFPATGYISMAVEALNLLAGEAGIALVKIHDLVFERAMAFNDDNSSIETLFSVKVSRSDGQSISATFGCHSCPEGDQSMTRNASGRIEVVLGKPMEDSVPCLTSPDQFNMVDVNVDRFYSALARVGYHYAEPFKGMVSVQRKMGTARGTLKDQSGVDWEDGLIIHPGMLDTALQTIFAAFSYPGDESLRTLHVPVGIDSLIINPAFSKEGRKQQDIGWASAIQDEDKTCIKADLQLLSDDDRNIFVQIEGVTLKPFAPVQASDSLTMFSHFEYLEDRPNGDKAVLGHALDSEELQVAKDLERIAFYYLRRISEIPAKDRVSALPHHRHLMAWADHIVNQAQSGSHLSIAQEYLGDTQEHISALTDQHRDHVEAILIESVGKGLPGAIMNRDEGLDGLMDKGLLDRFCNQGMNRNTTQWWLAGLAKQISHRYPHMKILEIGGKRGGITQAALSSLGTSFSSYAYTDASSESLEAAEGAFKDYGDRMVFQVFDVTKSPTEQGLTAGSYDLVLASNALTIAEDLDGLITNVRELLKPGGYLVGLETISNDILRNGIIMGCLPDWWLGAETGRPHGPMLDMQSWDALFRRCGFGGVETSSPIQDDLAPVAVFAAQSQDDRIATLKSPSKALTDPFPASHPLLLIGGMSLNTWSLVDKIRSMLSTKFTSLKHLSSVEALTRETVPSEATVVSLTDLDEPLMKSLTEAKMDGLKALWAQGRNVLWVTKNARCDEPYAYMMHGIGRVVRYENPNLNLQLLDVDSADDEVAQYIVDVLLRHQLLDDWRNAGTAGDLLWSSELELSLVKGKTLIPRLYPNKAQNARVNSARAAIFEDVDPATTAIKFVRSDSSAGLEAVTALESMAKSSGDDGAKKKLRIKQSLLTSINLGALGSMTLCIGVTDDESSSSAFLALTDQSISPVLVDPSCILEVPAAPDFGKMALIGVATQIIAHHLLSSVPKGATLLVHEAEKPLQDAIRCKARTAGVAVAFTTCQSDKRSTDCTFLHPAIPKRLLSKHLPREVTAFADFSTNDTPSGEIACAIEKLLPVYCLRMRSSTFFSNVQPRLRPGASLGEIESVLRRAWTDAIVAGVSVGSISTIPLGDVSRIARETADQDPLTVIDWSVPTVPVRVRPIDHSNIFRPDRTYLLLGLSGEVGQSLCTWMVGKGARHVVLTSRKPMVDPDFIYSLQSKGADVRAMSLDLTSRESLMRCLDNVKRTMPKIAGITNGAMILADGPFAEMDLNDMSKVLKPKVDGSIMLDEIFHDDVLDFFIMFSSVTACFGNSGQSNYAAANMFMTSLTFQRRKRGVAASVIDLTSLMGIGHVGRSEVMDADYFRSLGVTSVCETDLHQIFAEAIHVGRPDSTDSAEIVTGVSPMSRSEIEKTKLQFRTDLKFSHLCIDHEASNQGQASAGLAVPLKTRLKNSGSRDEVTGILLESFIARIKTILQIPADEIISANDALVQRGVDSLIALDIRLWFMRELGVDMPVLRILSSQSILDLINDSMAKLPASIVDFDTANGDSPAQSPAQGLESKQKIQLLEAKQPKSLSLPSSPSSSRRASTSDEDSENPSLCPMDTPILTSQDDTSSIEELGWRESIILSSSEVLEPISFGQTGFWFLHHALEDKTTLNVSVSIRVTGLLQLDVLAKALHDVADKHEAMRTRFFWSGVDSNIPTMGVLSQSLIQLEHRTISDKAEAAKALGDMQKHEWDLGDWESMRFVLLSLSEDVHWLVFGCHHITFDGASIQIMLADLFKAYSGQGLHRLPEESQYRTHSLLQRQQLEEGHFQKAINFYGNIIPPDVQPIALLPFSKQSSRQAQASHLAYSAQVCLSGSETARIKQMARQNQSTSFHLYLAALQAMLFRLLPDTSELFIGITDANRNDSQFAETLGLFLNLLPIRFDRPAAKAKFSSAIKATRRKVYAALEHASLPFDVLITELGISRSTTNTPPVFQVLVDYQQKTQEGPGFVGINVVAEASHDARTGYDISLHLLEKGEGDIVVTLQLQQSLYTQEQTDLLLRGYISFVKGLTKVSGRESLVDGPALWAEDDISHVLDLGKGPLNPLVWPETVSHRVSQMAVAHASEPALKDGCGRAFSYAEMDCRVKSIAASLGKAGITKDDIVGILQEPSADWICSMLAIFHVGATYLPLDLRNSVHRLRNAVKAAKPAAILTDPTTIDAAGTIDAPDAKILDVSQIALESGSSETSTQASGDSAAVILFTSGSTGEPKGVVIKHSNLVAQNEGFSKQFNLAQDRRLRVLQQSAFSFDFSLEQIFFTLCNGGCLYVVSSEKRQDPYEVTKIILEEGINYTSATTSEYKNWLQYSQEHLQKCSQWEYALCSGEAFSIDLLRQFKDLQLPSLRLLTDYGPSETTISCTHQGWIDYTIDNQDSPLGVGSAAPNYSVYIVDHQLNLLPAGVPGEIMISGVGVSAGYLGQDDVTKDKFLPNPVRKVNSSLAVLEHAIAYRSGDRGYLRDDGALVVEGRIDGDAQVKIRGFRVELAEIEEVLVRASKGALKHAIVTMREHSGDKFLAAHVVFSREHATDDRQSFLDNIQASLPLPDYMRPTVIVAVESLPLTAHSKVNRRAAMALPIDAGMAATTREDGAAAGQLTPAEARLAELWKDVLPLMTTRAISSESNFFHVGGNSLLLVKLQKEIKQAFSTAPKLLDLMNASQLKEMAAVVTTASLARIDWLEETAIPSSWAVKFSAPYDQETRRDVDGKLSILLTGATGYLGRHLVPALIQSDKVAKVVCLVRSESKVDDLSKASDKIVIVVGNLGEANLGLTEVGFEQLSSEVDVVVHCGANRSFWDGYEALRAANTISVKELARLALPRRLPFHFLSSGSVRIYDGSGEGAAIYNMEQSAAVGKTPPEDGTDGYVASKWAAEAFLEAVAAQFHLPLTLHTPMPVPYYGPDDMRAAPETDEMLSELVDITKRLGVRPSMQGLAGWVDIMRTQTIVNGILRCVLEDGGSRRELYAGSRRIDWQRFRRELGTNVELSGLPTQDTLVWIGEAKKLGLSWFMPAHRLVILSDQGDMVSRR